MELALPIRLVRWRLQFESAAQLCAVDAATLAAICDRESRGGDALSPRGPGGTGDGGRGHGLMQVDSRYHPTFIAAVGPDGAHLWKQPNWNILYGATLLRMNLDRLEQYYPAAIAAYNASLARVRRALDSVAMLAPEDPWRIKALDSVTTGGNYVSNVLASRAAFIGKEMPLA